MPLETAFREIASILQPVEVVAPDPSWVPPPEDEPTYAGTPWTVKNLFELKNARKVLVEGNLLEHNWRAAQVGYAVLFKSTNQSGRCDWCVVEDVTFEYNIIRNVAAVFNLLGRDGSGDSELMRRITSIGQAYALADLAMRQERPRCRLSWATGMLEFRSEPLERVIAEVDRYTPLKIEIRDPQLRALPVSGRFRVGDTQAVFDALENGFGATAVREGDVVIITLGYASTFVAGFLGAERGLKRLALIAAAEVEADPGPAVRPHTSVAEAKDVAGHHGTDWVVVVDEERRLQGLAWLSEVDGVRSVGDAPLHAPPLSIRANDSLRTALDAMVTSHTGVAVRIGPEGTYEGILTQEILTREIV